MRLLPCLILGVSACGATPPPTATSTSTPSSTAAAAPTDALSALEARLLSAPSFRVRARLATSGRITCHYDGTVTAGPGTRVRLGLEGSFGNRGVSARWVSDGAKMRGGSREKTFDFDAPPALREGLVLSFVRQGLTHQAAKLSFGDPPDFLDGRAREHLQLAGLVHGPGGKVHAVDTELWTWTLMHEGKPAADENLWVDPATGLPLRRRVTVHFPEGDMDVAEDYDEFVVGEAESDATFTIAP